MTTGHGTVVTESRRGDVLASPVAPTWSVEPAGETAVLRLSGDWLARETGLRSEADLRLINETYLSARRLRIDTSRVVHWDSALVAFLKQLATAVTSGAPRVELDLTSLPEALQRLLTLARADEAPIANEPERRRISVFERTGVLTIACWAQVVASAELVGVAVINIGPALTGRLRARAVDVILLMRECGFSALGIVGIVNGLVGAILGFVGAVQLRRFGAEIYVADLVGVAVVREMAPIMTAIVMAGRTGGAYAAQIATMQGNEEVDALQALGIPVHQFLVMPRIIAAVTMTPALYFYACFMGLLGGLVVSVAMLDLSPTEFLEHLRPAVAWTEFAIGLTKMVCFGIFVALAGCRTGLAAGRSAADVGRAATSAVVDGIIGIIALDAVFAACAEVLGI